MLINAGSVKARHSISVSGEMGRHPIQNHADSLTVHVIHKVHEIIRCSIAAGRRVIARYLIAPGGVQRMLHHRHQLHMRISHVRYILRQLHRQLPVVVKLCAGNLLSLAVRRALLTHPGAQMNLIDIHGLVLRISPCPPLHPLLIRPREVVYLPYDGGVIGS